MKSEKILRILIISIVICLMLSGCGILTFNRPGNEDADETTFIEDTTASDELDEYENDYDSEVNDFLKDLSGNTYNGGTFQIAVIGKNLISPDDKTPLVISEDMKERNSYVENKLDIQIISKTASAATVHDEIKAAVLSGSYYADAILLPQMYIGEFVQSGSIINMRSLPGFDYNNGYTYPTSVSAGTGGDAVYAVAGPACLDPDTLSCMYFNKTLIEELGLESPYSLVRRGEWTVDKYLEYAGKAKELEGVYSYGSQNVTPYISDLFFFAFGGKLTDSNVGYYPAIALTADGTEARVAKVSSAVNMEKALGSSLEGYNTFNSGKMLFFVDRVSTMKNLADSPVEWGILPLPKQNAEQADYLSLAYYGDTQFFGAVATAPNYGEVADVISALNILAYGYSADNYVTNASYYYLRDNSSMDMLSYAISHPVYDFAYSFGEVNSYVANGTFMAVRNTVTGISSLQRYIDMYYGLFQNSMYSMFNVK